MIESRRFNELNVEELYDLLKLRSEVFVVEQSCVYLDVDDVDKTALHFFYKEDEKIISYLRVYTDAKGRCHIGRVVTSADHRGRGLSRLMMNAAIDDIIRRGAMPIHLSGQSYLKGFYESLDFRVITDLYLEDGIPHYGMIRDTY